MVLLRERSLKFASANCLALVPVVAVWLRCLQMGKEGEAIEFSRKLELRIALLPVSWRTPAEGKEVEDRRQNENTAAV